MPLPMIESIPEFGALSTLLREHSLSDIVHKVLGGSPLEYTKLRDHMDATIEWLKEQSAGCLHKPGKDEVTAMVRDYLHHILLVETLYALQDPSPPKSSTRDIVRVMQDLQVTSVSTCELYSNHVLRLETPNMLLHQTPNRHIEPCSQALTLLIEHKLCDGSSDDINNLLDKLFAVT